MRLIDADAMRKNLIYKGKNEYVYDANTVLNSIDEQPTITTEILRHITREQMEKMRGKWIADDGTSADIFNERTNRSATCSRCGRWLVGSNEFYCNASFCPACGAPMTDKAVDILWKRLEEMQDAE